MEGKYRIKVDGMYLGRTELRILDLIDNYNELQVWKIAEFLSSSLRYQRIVYSVIYNMQNKGLVELKKTGKKNGLIASLTPLGKNMLIKVVLQHEKFFYDHVVEA